MMTFILEEELSTILEKIYSEWEKRDIALQEVRDLYFEAKEKYLQDKGVKSEKASGLMLKILFTVGRINEEFIKKWQEKNITPTNRELKLIEEGCEEVLKAFDDHFKKELLAYQKKPYPIHHAGVKGKIKQIRKMLSESRELT